MGLASDDLQGQDVEADKDAHHEQENYGGHYDHVSVGRSDAEGHAEEAEEIRDPRQEPEDGDVHEVPEEVDTRSGGAEENDSVDQVADVAPPAILEQELRLFFLLCGRVFAGDFGDGRARSGPRGNLIRFLRRVDYAHGASENTVVSREGCRGDQQINLIACKLVFHTQKS